MTNLPAKLNRRAFLQMASLSLGAVALPTAFINTVIAQQKRPNSLTNTAFYRFRLGNFQCISVSDGILNAPAAAFAGGIPAEKLKQALSNKFQPTDSLQINCNILYVNNGHNQVLIDTGNGGLASTRAVGRLVTNLRLAGINPSNIDAIIITHAHADHIGGFTDKAGRFLFANARYYIHDVEYDFWTNPKARLPKLPAGEKLAQEMLSIAKKSLGLISKRVTKFSLGKEIIPGFSAINASGHTPGHVAIKITAKDASLIHVADTVHHFAINLSHPEWQPVFDADPIQAVTTRQRILSQILTDRSLMFAYHFPFPGLGNIQTNNEGGFNWEPVAWQFDVTN